MITGNRIAANDLQLFCPVYGSCFGCTCLYTCRAASRFNLQVAQKDSKLSKRLAEIRKVAALL